jgi:pyruvate dehydrogenase E1 component alpha subunit
MFNLINADGTVRDRLPVTVEELRRLYADMVEARAYDRKCMAMQRQGRLATYAPFEGQEAAQIGAARALRDDDWVVATYRDAALMWAAGYGWELLIAGRTGDERGGSPPPGVNVLPPSITVGGHMIHAVGLSWAEKLKGSDRIALTSFGDGATSEGDFHEAMNFAAVFQTPTVFFCQNNHYAISEPVAVQTRIPLVDRPAGFGIPAVQVDGNDVLAVMAVTRQALDRARTGGGPSFIEAVTYRMGPHTTADDPTRYRAAGELEVWAQRDPISRLRALLAQRAAFGPELETRVAEVADRVARELRAGISELDDPPALDVFSHVYAEPHHSLDRQRDEYARYLEGFTE